jgi:hypothetical protein
LIGRFDLAEVLEAAALEKEYDWVGAKDLYEQALSAVDEGDHLSRGEIQERMGYSLRRAAFQAGSREEFRNRVVKAIEAYEKAHGFYEKLTDERGAPWMLRCRAISRDLSHWLASDPSKKRRLLDECLELEEKALEAFSDIGDMLEYGRTYNELPLAAWYRVHLEWDREVRRRIIEKGLRWGEKAVTELSELVVPYEIARVTFSLVINMVLFNRLFVAEPEKQEEYRLKNVERLQDVVEFSERVGDDYLAGLSHIIWGHETGGVESIRHYNKALECGEETGDIYLKGLAQDSKAQRIYWFSISTDDPDQRRKLAEEAMELYDEAQRLFSVLSFLYPRIGLILAPGGYAEHYLFSTQMEIDLENILELLEKSEKAGLKALKVAEDSDIPHVIDRMCHYLSKTLWKRATFEKDVDMKRSLLETALKYRERNIEIEERLFPYDYWNVGIWNSYLALINEELAYVEPDPKDKKRLLKDAAEGMEKSLENISKMIPFIEKKGSLHLYVGLYWRQDKYEVILSRLYEVTKETEYLRKAIEISRKAIESASKLDAISWMAETYWKIAGKHDHLGEHLEAAENFRHASEGYMKAAEKMPQLNELYQDHVTYMQAWSEIERARYYHKEKKYGVAKTHFKKAAELHESTARWNYLSPNYLAWARLEEAEDLSRTELTQEAKDIFQEAAKLFVKAKESIETKLKTIEAGDERQITEELVKASGVRREYCLGRMALEEARILDRQGDHLASSRRYGQATERFQKVIDAMEEESDLRELRPIVYLSQAWQKMMMAEARASPRLYGDAAELFEQAREHALDQKTSLLAQANNSFCRALEAGARFEINRDAELFAVAKNHIEAATNYYLRAGLESASEYANATSRLLDAYMYTYRAQTEPDPVGKARFYRMSERLLQSSAGSYLKAKHPEKSEEVRRILGRIKGEREIAVSLTEVLHAPVIASTTTSFSTPTPTYEQAVGLERFEYADVQANLILRERQVKVGEDINLEVELVNAGKASAQLIKINEIIPKGFEVRRAPDICRVEDSYIDMKGRTLNPLKTEELRLVLRPLNTGAFHLKPRILYLDESGRYKSHEPEPITVEVRRRRGPPI